MASRPTLSTIAVLAGFGCLTETALAQTFTSTPAQIPGTGGNTENADFADTDGDGDLDIILAQGGDSGNAQNNIWINQGGAQGGVIGVFIDRTSTLFPAVLDSSRDVEFVDIDADGDVDIHVSNHSSVSNQTSRWWVNMGGAQGGTPGSFQDQTSTRWAGLNTAPTSIAAGQLLPIGFFDWVGDSDFGDLDNDGDLDLVHSSYGGAFSGLVPTRLFLNDGSGVFTEFNPSGFRLSTINIANGNPALWASGTQQANTTNNTGSNADIASTALDIDVMDIDGDLDLDILHGARGEPPRMLRNRLVENGGVLASFTDVTSAVFPPGYASGSAHYEQEMGDCDNDGDVDVYGLNWVGFNDITLRNNGLGLFSNQLTVPASSSDDSEVDFLDYDNDGDLDAYVANFSGQDRLYRNDFPGSGDFSFTNVTATHLPSLTRQGLDADCADIDNDGDTDVIVANGANQAEYLLKNNSNNFDPHAPRAVNLEQAPNRTAGAAPTVVRVQVYDNAAYYVAWYQDVQLEYRVVPAGFTPVAMRASQGQIWRGEIPGALTGTIEYRVRATDRNGNLGVSSAKTFDATGNGVNPGSDLWNTPGLGCTYQEFPVGSLPANFFGVGGNPWPSGSSMYIGFVGLPLAGSGMVGNVDTIVERLAPANIGVCGTQDTVPIQIKALSLESFKSVTVNFGGNNNSKYDVVACLENIAQPLGSMTIRREHALGGTFDSTLPVIARLTFTKVSGANGVASATLPGALITFQNPGNSGVSACWSYDDGGLGIPSSPGGSGVDCAGNAFNFAATSNFYAGVCRPGADCFNPGGPAEPQLTQESALLAQHCVLPVALSSQVTGYCYCGPNQPPGAPCGNFDPNAGCINSTGQGMRLDVVGATTVTPDTAVFTVTGGPPNGLAVLIWGTTATFGHLGDGQLCVFQARRTGVVSLDVLGGHSWTNVSISSLVPPLGDIRTYQVWYRNAGGPCLQGTNLSNAYQVLWLP